MDVCETILKANHNELKHSQGNFADFLAVSRFIETTENEKPTIEIFAWFPVTVDLLVNLKGLFFIIIYYFCIWRK